ncbi:hypothetical protein SAMN02990966_01620 [Rhodospirillales bacterium URHD0017]|nr:hypothetical protein SAMN02990966_01620 [Rhodospirillales bacterium URHD0017]
MYSVPPTLRREPITTPEARYLAGLVALNAVAAEFQLWREFECTWAGRPDRPSFAVDFSGNAIILAAVAVSFFIAGIFAVRRVYGTAGDSVWERSARSAFVQWLYLTALAVPVALGVVPLLTALMIPWGGIGIFMIVLAKFGLLFALATAIWNLAFVVLIRPKS